MTTGGVADTGQVGHSSPRPLGVNLGDVASLFPLPLIEHSSDPGRGSCGRHSQQRRCRAARLTDDANDSLRALNWLAGKGEPGPGPLSDLHRRVHASVLAAVSDYMPESAIPSRQAAFSQLLRGRSVYAGSTNPNLATFTSVSRVSLPPDLADAPCLEDLLPPHLRHLVSGSVQRLLRSDAEFKEMCEKSPLPEPYWDVAVRGSRRRYVQLMRALIRIGLVRVLPGGSGKEREREYFS